MAAMKEFWLWWFEQLPDFLMEEPICYFMGFVFGALAVGLIRRIINIK